MGADVKIIIEIITFCDGQKLNQKKKLNNNHVSLIGLISYIQGLYIKVNG